MSYHFSDPSREHDTYSLPDVEVFYVREGEWWYDLNGERCDDAECGEEPCKEGWYYWFCFPGCLPDSEPFGPFDTEEQAVADCRENFSQED